MRDIKITHICDFIRLGRFIFLGGGVIMYGLGSAIAYFEGFEVDWGVWLWGQVIVTLTQLMVHYANDYFDVAADQVNTTPTAWSGGSRVLIDGRIAPRVALITAVILGSGALALAVLLIFFRQTGTWTLPLIVTAIGLSWAYSAPPFSLHARGVGEFAATLIVTVLTPMLGFYLQSGTIRASIFLAIIPLACLQFNMLVGVDIPDAEGDKVAGKYTLAVRLGKATMSKVYAAVLIVAYGSLPILWMLELPWLVALSVCLTMPLALWQGYRVVRSAWSKHEQWSSINFFNLVLLVGAGILEISAFVVLSMR